MRAQVPVRTHTHACACTHTPPCPTAFLGRVPASHGFSPATLTLLLSLLLEVGTSYYAVAVVKRNSPVTINTLKGVKSCHTGINRTVGWNVPVGYLVESGRLSVMGCNVLKGKGFRPGRNFSCRSTGFPSLPLPCLPLTGDLPRAHLEPPVIKEQRQRSSSRAFLVGGISPSSLVLAGLVLLPCKFWGMGPSRALDA